VPSCSGPPLAVRHLSQHPTSMIGIQERRGVRPGGRDTSPLQKDVAMLMEEAGEIQHLERTLSWLYNVKVVEKAHPHALAPSFPSPLASSSKRMMRRRRVPDVRVDEVERVGRSEVVLPLP
jgi:hypothetical protein